MINERFMEMFTKLIKLVGQSFISWMVRGKKINAGIRTEQNGPKLPSILSSEPFLKVKTQKKDHSP